MASLFVPIASVNGGRRAPGARRCQKLGVNLVGFYSPFIAATRYEPTWSLGSCKTYMKFDFQGLQVDILTKFCQAPVKRIAALEDAFNNCIESLLKYCSLRQRFLTSFGIGFPRLKLFLMTQVFMDEIWSMRWVQTQKLYSTYLNLQEGHPKS